jgi:hypothetical protein
MKSAIKEYREISMSITGEKAGIYNSNEPLYPGSKNTCGLKKGRYMIVPSCKRLGDMGKFFLGVYVSLPEEKFSLRYVNPYNFENTDHFHGKEIEEEDEE